MKYYLVSGSLYVASAAAIALGYKLITFLLFMFALYFILKAPFFHAPVQN